ncbi:MAG: 30S ribosomal protein S2, partial [Candidatus Omnitrophota bacterium]
KMDRLPGAVFIIDAKKEEIAVNEANKLSIPVVAFADTDCNPDKINYIIPGNDDAMKSISFVTSLIAKSIKEGRDQFLACKKDIEKDEKLPEETIAAATEEEIEDLVGGDIKLEKVLEDEPKKIKPIRKKNEK